MNNYNPLISVIVPIYNAEATLERCIDGILSQDYTNVEVILIDDGSTDHSAEICERYKLQDSRVVVKHKENGGVSSARNVGLEIATGDYVAFADADDWVTRDWLKIFSPQDADLYIEGFVSIDPLIGCKRHDVIIDSVIDVRELICQLWEKRVFGYLFNKLFKHDIIKEFGLYFNRDLKYREDDLFCSRYFEYCNTIIVRSEIGYYYVLPSSNKGYGTSVCAVAEELFMSQMRIFEELPQCICEYQSWTIKGALENMIALRQVPSKDFLEIYKTVFGRVLIVKRTPIQKLYDKIVSLLSVAPDVIFPLLRLIYKIKHR